MTTPVASQQLQSPDGQPTQDSLTITQIALILAAGLAVKATIDHLLSTVAGTGIGRQALVAAWRAGQFGLRHRGVGPDRISRGTVNVTVAVRQASPVRSPATLADEQAEPLYRAAYLLASSRRIQDARNQALLNGEDPDAAVRAAAAREAQYYAAHEHAVTNRRRAARAVDSAARRGGSVGVDPVTGLPTLMVGWNAVLDSKTSAECRAADGHAFPATRAPAIGWPGAVHPHCRCTSGLALPGMPLLDGTGFYWPTLEGTR